MGNHRKISERMLERYTLLVVAMCFCGFPVLKAQDIYVDTVTNIKTTIFTYSFGISGCASDNGASAWKNGSNPVGIVNTLQFMRYSSSNNLGYGAQLLGYTESKTYNKKTPDEKMKERVRIIYIAPQVAYLKRTVAFDNCFGVMGGGVGYLSYQSKSNLPGNESNKATCSSVGLNAFIGLEYTFAKHWGIRFEVNALYTPLNLKYEKEPELAILEPRSKFSLFMLNTQIGISCHL